MSHPGPYVGVLRHSSLSSFGARQLRRARRHACRACSHGLVAVMARWARLSAAEAAAGWWRRLLHVFGSEIVVRATIVNCRS